MSRDGSCAAKLKFPSAVQLPGWLCFHLLRGYCDTQVLTVPGSVLCSAGTEVTLNWRTTYEAKAWFQCLLHSFPTKPHSQLNIQYKLCKSRNLIWLTFSCVQNVQNNV